MGTQDEQASVATSIINESLQNITNYCTIACNNDISNLNITIIGGNATVNISQSCSIIGSECMMKNIMDTQIENVIKNLVEQTQSNMGIFSLLGPSSSANTNITNSIKNQISQIVNNSCQASANNSIVNSSIYVQDNNLKLNIAQVGTVQNSQCALDTVAKLLLNNDVTNTVKQKQTSCGNILGILIIIIIIILIILLAPLIFRLGSGLGKKASGDGSNKNQGQGSGQYPGFNVNFYGPGPGPFGPGPFGPGPFGPGPVGPRPVGPGPVGPGPVGP